MINAEVNNGSVKLHMNGSLMDIEAEVSHLLTGIYNALLEHDEDAAETFKHAMTRAIAEDLVFQPKHRIDSVLQSAIDRKMDETRQLLEDRGDGEIADLIDGLVDLIRKQNKNCD